MKTLIFDGSPRKNGDTTALLSAFLEGLDGEYTVIRAYEQREISPCMDCRACWKQPGCVIRDQELYLPIYRQLCGGENG